MPALAYKKRMNISELTTGIIEGQISRLQEADEPVQIDYEIEPWRFTQKWMRTVIGRCC